MKGSCLCGAVQYSFDKEPALVFACHCLDSQKWTGSAFSLMAVFPRDSFRLQGSPKGYSAAADTGRSVTRHFCSDCGSSLYMEVEKAPGVIVAAVGTLEGGANLVPKRHAWVKRKHSWVTLDPEVQQFLEEMP